MKRKGFTLVELMVVVSIIGILAAVTIPMYSKYKCRASWGDVQGSLADISMKLENYKSNHGRYPSSGTAWADLGYDGGAPPEQGDHYVAGLTTTSSTYLVYFKDSKNELTCTRASTFDNDVWAITSKSPKVYHVYNTEDGSEEPLPAGFTIP